jgi:hypothetical protein
MKRERVDPGWAEAFANGVASTAICSPALALPGLLLEVEAIAVIGRGQA